MRNETLDMLRRVGETFKRALEERDSKLLASVVGQDTLMHAFGEFGDGEEAVALFDALKHRAEEIVLSFGDPAAFREDDWAISCCVPVDVSFVATSTWQLRRYCALVALRFQTANGPRLRGLSINELSEVGIPQPESLERAAGIPGPGGAGYTPVPPGLGPMPWPTPDGGSPGWPWHHWPGGGVAGGVSDMGVASTFGVPSPGGVGYTPVPPGQGPMPWPWPWPWPWPMPGGGWWPHGGVPSWPWRNWLGGGLAGGMSDANVAPAFVGIPGPERAGYTPGPFGSVPPPFVNPWVNPAERPPWLPGEFQGGVSDGFGLVR